MTRLKPSRAAIESNHTCSPSSLRRRELKLKDSGLFDNKFKMFIVFNISLLICVLGYVWHLHKLQSEIVTPLDSPKMVSKAGLDVPNRYWGTYRSQLYFGMKNRHRDPVNFGLMWFNQKPRGNNLNIRHWCSQRDGLQKYTWLRHDGVHFGEQVIIDGDLNITTSFVKRPGEKGGEWTARISVENISPDPPKPQKKPEPMSLFFYAMADFRSHNLSLDIVDKTRVEALTGGSPEVGDWRLRFDGGGSQPIKYGYLSTVIPSPDEVVDVIQKNVKATKLKDYPLKLFFVQGSVFAPTDPDGKPNFISNQVTVVPPYTMEVMFENVANDPERDLEEELKGDVFSKELHRYRRDFDERFDKTFPLQTKFQIEEINVAKAALSNMLGSIGYFFGQSLVRGPNNRDTVPYWPAALYTAVPSRSFFPRGFLWDEGFHNLLISRWDAEISKDIIAHWLDLMNTNGWIPREQILGDEARAMVPNEFIVQKSTNANPPTMFLAIQTLLDMMKRGEIPEDTGFISSAYPRLKAIFTYFQREQQGPISKSYRWRGRNPEIRTELNPKTLASGLDDYPRASHPTDNERHLDLRCWVALMAEVLADIGERIGLPEDSYKEYKEIFAALKDNNDLNKQHWSPSGNQYSDFGLHTDDVMLVSQRPKPGEPSLPMLRYTAKAPTERFVDQFGYVSLFPLIMRLLEVDSSQLGQMLSSLDDPTLLWTDFGLRSLSKDGKLYNARNTEHDPPYWRGNIWINMNFLVVRALKYYAQIDGPHRNEARRLHNELQQNIVRNVIRQYHKSGYLWENYKDETGKGSGSHPFTGWTSLVVLLMSDQY
ncbi:mannosyl-oligosaccharide glucosidase-like isoform X2 [Varroa jacobsoni]|uniref:Mannosyl-oligosaccharide glucosidase n=2 Tax=Varroa TaxID=62624 RepID=A0A7M7K9I5_VARDE|nr:mannosyl-oligosaccharide glucosidase-like [Varroa destructor]XP_022663583.1 mannosyl-oligosaccharide glucosidase-like [Varroa destructor]XP_022700691.1 mannosyl-oligosaccharide glucosidase-like isoform X2 [Varroa jacobsoni]XP_022700692.1 mannosyl-oligosaccharide glucosidase-like isoform X2 [Varroa jacobsoni]